MMGAATRCRRLMFAAGLAVALSGVISSSAWAGDPSALPVSSASVAGELVPTSAAARVNALAMRKGALGTYPDGSGVIVVVVPASGSSSFSVADAAGVGVPIRVETRNIDKPTIDAIQSRLRHLRPAFSKSHSYFSYFDVEQGAVVVQSDAQQADFSLVTSAFRGKVIFRSAALSLDSGRKDDEPPHWGGAWIQDANYTACTSGYAVQIGSVRHMVTAGHCYGLNSTIWGFGKNYLFGTVTKRLNYPTTDAGLISGTTYSGVIYTDPTTTYRLVGGYSVGVVGANYCVSGITTLNHCGHTDIDNNGQFCAREYGGGCATGLITFRNGTITTSGDSGGPWYALSGGRAYILGSHVGTACDIFMCTMYAVPFTRIKSLYGASIVVY